MDVETNAPEVSSDSSTGALDSIRGALESAFDAAAASSPDAGAGPESASSAPETSGSSDRPRGPDGKFVKKEAEEASHGAADSEVGAKAAGAKGPSTPVAKPVVVDVSGATAPVQDKSPVQELKPPQSWKPAARELWATLPDAVKAEIARREGDTSKVLNETAEARKLRETFQQTVAPYEAMLRSENSEPMRAVQNLLETARQLRQSPPHQRAALVAQIVQHYGVPIDALDAALAGQPYRGPAANAPMQDPRVDQLLQQIEQAKAQRAQQEASEADAAVTAFGQDKEWFDDVREDMADIIEIAEKRGQKIDLDTAYKRALAMNEEISAVMRQREEAAKVANAKASTQRSRAAAGSVKSAGPGQRAAPAAANSIRDALEAAWEDAAA